MSDNAVDLNQVRQQITETDNQLLSLLAERRKLTSLVADAKIASGKPVRDQEREEQLLIELVKKARNLSLDAHFVTRIFHTIIEDSVLNQQAKLQQLANPDIEQPLHRVAFLGTKGSYSYLATQKYFARRPGELMEIGCGSFGEIIQAVETNKADYAVLPIENTSSGSINEVFDVLQHTSLSIIGELTHPIRHAMLVSTNTNVDNIRQLYAHPQVFAQCSHYLAGLSDIKMNPVESTSAAMLKVSELNNPTVAALGSAEGGSLYGLNAIESNLANQKENHSRFIVVARKPVEVPDQLPAKTTLIMSTAQRPGSLVEALLVLRDKGINMTKLESRPITGNPWEEMFYLDIDANLNKAATREALQELVRLTRFIKVLGCYPSEEVHATEVPTSAIVHQSEAPQIAEKGQLSSRNNQADDSVIQVKKAKIGNGHFSAIAHLQQFNYKTLSSQLNALKDAGAEVIAINPDSAQQAADVKQQLAKLDMPLAVSVKEANKVNELAKIADILIINSEDMEDQALLKQVGLTHRAIILQRGLISTLEQWLNAAETILAQGNQQVILCEQGVRTLDSSSRYTLDLSALPLIKQRTHLPIVIAPQLTANDQQAIENLAIAGQALKASGVVIPVAEQADPKQLDMSQFKQLMTGLFNR